MRDVVKVAITKSAPFRLKKDRHALQNLRQGS
jgi:hypothetical protein